MKQLFLLISFFLIVKLSFTQIINVNPIGSPNVINKYAGSVAMDQMLALPKGSGAPSALLFQPFNSKYRAPYLYVDTTNSIVYWYNPYTNAVMVLGSSNVVVIPPTDYLDSTGQPQYRLLFALPGNKVGSSGFYLVDTLNQKIVIGNRNVSWGGNNIKLGVNGNVLLNGNLNIQDSTASPDVGLTLTYKRINVVDNRNGVYNGSFLYDAVLKNFFTTFVKADGSFIDFGLDTTRGFYVGRQNNDWLFRMDPIGRAYLPKISLGVATDSVLVINNGEVKKVAAITGGSSGGQIRAQYTWSTATTNSPANSRVNGNNATQTANTILYFNKSGADGVDNSLKFSFITAGQQILIQDESDATSYQVYIATAASTFADPVISVPVAWSKGGTNLNNNQRMQLGIFMAGSGLNGNGYVKQSGTTSNYINQIPLNTDVTNILPINNGGTGTTTPGIVAGTGISVSGAWPNQTVNSTVTAPSLPSTQVAFGNGSNQISGSSNFTYASNSLSILNSVVGTNPVKSISLENPTAATSSVTAQYSPSLDFAGSAWNSSAPGNSATSRWHVYVQPISNAYGAGITGAQGNLNFTNDAFGSPSLSISYNGNLIANYATINNTVQGATGTFNTVAGAQQILGGLAYPSAQQTYRTTNVGSDITPQFLISAINTGAGNPFIIMDRTSGIGLGFGAWNTATTKVMRASIYVTDLNNTAGSEAGGIGFATQNGGTAAVERMRITAAGNVTLTGQLSIGAYTLPNTDGLVSGQVLKTNGSGLVSWQGLTAVKNILPVVSNTALTPSTTNDMCVVTALAVGLTINAPTGTPTQGQELLIRIKDNGTSQTIIWAPIYRASSDLPLPTATSAGKTQYDKFIWNNEDAKWDLLAVLNNF